MLDIIKSFIVGLLVTCLELLKFLSKTDDFDLQINIASVIFIPLTICNDCFPQIKPSKIKDAPMGPPVWLDVSLEAGTVLTHVSQTTIHTIALSARAWGQTGLMEAERVIFNHYIICNDTHEALRFGQVSAFRNKSLLLLLPSIYLPVRNDKGCLCRLEFWLCLSKPCGNYYFRIFFRKINFISFYHCCSY